MSRAHLGWIVMAAACQDAASGAADTPAASAVVREPVTGSSAITGDPLPAPAASSAAPGTATPAASAASLPGRSAMPTASEWAAAAEVTVKGSSALGCETKLVREWLRVLCRGKNDGGGTPTRVAISSGAAPGTQTHTTPTATSLVTPYVVGTRLVAQFSWTDRSHTLRIDGPAGAAAPAILGVFEGAKSPLDQVRATCAGKLRCPSDKPICVATQQGPPHCAAAGSPEYLAVPSEARFPCTHQSDCLAEEGCFLTFGEHEVEWRTYCGRYAGGQAACDMTRSCDEAKDPTCVPCISFGLAGLPWFGFH